MTGARGKVVLALGQSAWEATFVTGAVAQFIGCDVQRCVDVTSLIIGAKENPGQLVIVDAEFPRLDSPVVATLEQQGTRLVGVATTAQGMARLTSLGIDDVVTMSPGGAGSVLAELRRRWLDTDNSLGGTQRSTASNVADQRRSTGRLTTVWGAPGSPGRTSVAIMLAQLTAAQGTPAFLIDADTTTPGVSTALCLESEGSGLAAACHHGERGTLDTAVLARLARSVDDQFRVLTGISHVSRRGELRAAALAKLWKNAVELSPQTIVDIGGCVDDGSLALDSDVADFGINSGGQSAAVTALAVADELVAVTTCEPEAIARLLSHLGSIRSFAPTARLHIVINRVRAPIVRNAAAAAQLRDFVLGQSRASDVVLVAEDRSTFDSAMVAGRTPFEQSRKSSFATNLAELSRLVGSPLLMSA